MPAETDAGITNFAGGNNPDIVVDKDDTLEVIFDTPFIHRYQKLAIAAGSGAYTYNLIYNVQGVLPGAIIFLRMEFVASANPTIVVKSEFNVALNTIATIQGQADQATVFLLILTMQETSWLKILGVYELPQ